jgi:opacity protein-like surface antigen
MNWHPTDSYQAPPGVEPGNGRTLKVALIVACAVVLAAAAAVAIAVAVRPQRASMDGDATANGSASTSSTPRDAMSLNGWTQFGGIDAHAGPSGDTVILDTHNTTATWTTKWSGLIAPAESDCTLHVSTRVRDISHTLGVPGGYGIGLATTNDDPQGRLTLNGTAIQYDFGQQGYRTAMYPDDSAFGLAPAALDHDWHTIEVSFTSGVASETVDGKVMVQQSIGNVCGRPVIRVWAGAVEFGDVSISRTVPALGERIAPTAG